MAGYIHTLTIGSKRTQFGRDGAGEGGSRLLVAESRDAVGRLHLDGSGPVAFALEKGRGRPVEGPQDGADLSELEVHENRQGCHATGLDESGEGARLHRELSTSGPPR